jgi:hypothetical protein
MPEQNAIAFFESVEIGTPVTVFGTTPRGRSIPTDGYTTNQRRRQPQMRREWIDERVYTPAPPSWWR